MIERLRYLLTNCDSLNHLKQIHALVTTIGATNNLGNLLTRQVLHSARTLLPRTLSLYVQQLLRFSRTVDRSSLGFAVRFFSVNAHFNAAIRVHVRIQRLSLSPTTFAFSSSLKSCAKIGHGSFGFSVHAQIKKLGFSSSVYVLTSLMDFYCKSDDMESARKVFDEIPERNVVSWNSILAGFLRAGNLGEARRVFDEIPGKDAVSWNSMITGYANSNRMNKALQLFDEMPERNLASWNAIASGYAKLGDMKSAQRMFEAMPRKNSVSLITMIAGYSKLGDCFSARRIFDESASEKEKDVFVHNAMIACYEQNNHPREALELFFNSTITNNLLRPDVSTLTSVVSACSQLGYLELGQWVESHAMQTHGITMDHRLGNAFLDLYAKCGEVERAHELFRALTSRDLISYSAMISGFGINGKASEAEELFREMVDEARIEPNEVTYKALLTAYSHAGLVEAGYACLASMAGRGVRPNADHYGIVVDLLGRAGRLEEALGVIQSMGPVEPHAGVWGALLKACKLHGRVGLGEAVARKCIGLRPDKAGYQSLLGDIYASAERWDEAVATRSAAEDKKMPGCSWAESGFGGS